MMDKALQIFTLLSLCVTAHQMTASNSFNATSETSLAEVTQETVTAVNNETQEITMIIHMFLTTSETEIVSSEIVHGEDQFQIKIAAIQKKDCKFYCEGPELTVSVIAHLPVKYTKKFKTYSYLTTVNRKTLGLNISLVGGVNFYLQDPESTANVTNTASVNVVCFYNSTFGLPQIILRTNRSSTFRIDTVVTPTAVSTPSITFVYTPAPNVPSYISMTVHVAVPDTQTEKSFIVSPPITYNRGVHQMAVTAKKMRSFYIFPEISCPKLELLEVKKKGPFHYFNDISCAELELDVKVSARINYKTFMGYSETVTGGQTLGLNIDLTNGLKIYPQNPEFTASATGTASVNVNFIGLPSFTKSAKKPKEVSLKVETTVFANSDGACCLGHRSLKIMFLLFCSLLPYN